MSWIISSLCKDLHSFALNPRSHIPDHSDDSIKYYCYSNRSLSHIALIVEHFVGDSSAKIFTQFEIEFGKVYKRQRSGIDAIKYHT